MSRFVNEVTSYYIHTNQINNLKTCKDKRSLSLFRLNTCSLRKNFDEFQYFIQSTNIHFDVNIISESRIIKNEQSIVDVKLSDYSYEFCPTESPAECTLLYIGNHFLYKVRKDLRIYKPCELESNFTEISNPKKTSIVTGYAFKHKPQSI